MIGRWIKNSLITDDQHKLRDFRTAYTLSKQYDRSPMFFVIVKMAHPDTHEGCSDIKTKLETMKMSHFKHDTPTSNLQMMN